MSDQERDPKRITLEGALTFEAMGWNVVINDAVNEPTYGHFALMPKQAADVDDWERRCQDMHDKQEPLELDPKPEAPNPSFQPREARQEPRPDSRPARQRSRVRGAYTNSPEANNDKLPDRHREGHGTIGLNVVKV